MSRHIFNDQARLRAHIAAVNRGEPGDADINEQRKKDAFLDSILSFVETPALGRTTDNPGPECERFIEWLHAKNDDETKTLPHT